MDITPDRLDRLRLVPDPAADQLVSECFAADRAARLYQVLQQPFPLLQPGAEPVAAFLLSVRACPDWLNQDLLRRGHSVFQAHTAPIMGILGSFSLPFCYAAAPGNKALYLSDKMRKAPGKRLLDTARFVQAVCQSGDTEAFTYAVNRTRLIHAIARWHLHARGWNQAWGEPINQEDMAGTNLAFSYLVLLGLQQSGVTLSVKEKEGYLHLWRFIGYALHIEEELLPADLAGARTLTNVIRKRNLQKSAEGIALTRELIQFYQEVSGSRDARPIEAQLAWYLGPEVAGFLGIEVSPSAYRWVNFVHQCNTLGRLLDRPLPGLDPFARLQTAFLRQSGKDAAGSRVFKK